MVILSVAALTIFRIGDVPLSCQIDRQGAKNKTILLFVVRFSSDADHRVCVRPAAGSS